MDALEAHMLMRSRELMRYWDRASSGDWARVLTTFSLFSGLSKRRLRKLVRHATFTEFASGHTIVAADVSDDSLYVILSGTAKARGDSVTRTLGVGDYFGKVDLLDGGPGDAAVVATGQLHAMRLPRQSFLRLTQDGRVISLTRLRSLGARLRRFETQAARC